MSIRPARSQRRVGRPRLLTLQQIADSALDIGLEHFTMKRIADTLGVGLATLYEYVESREALLQLAVARKVEDLPLAVDRGQHWVGYLTEYARSLQAILTDHSEIMTQFLVSGFGLEAELRIADRFMQALASRGFGREQAAKLLRATGYIAIGAAICLRRATVSKERWATSDPTDRDMVDRWGSDGLRALQTSADVYYQGIDDLAADLLRPLIAETARERGETLPDQY